MRSDNINETNNDRLYSTNNYYQLVRAFKLILKHYWFFVRIKEK